MEAIWQAIISNQVISWGAYIVLGICLLPVCSTALDFSISILSDIMTRINLEIVDKIPIPPIKDWLQNKQVDMLKDSIDTINKAIDKIKEK